VRRTGYRWLTDRPALLLNEEYPAWKQARQREALNRALPYIIVIAVCAIAGAALVDLMLRRRRQARQKGLA
jgi:hypothetical protein